MSWHVWHFSWSQARNLQELINSTTGVVLAPEIQPGPHHVFGTVNGTDVFALFCHLSQNQVPILQLGTWEQWG